MQGYIGYIRVSTVKQGTKGVSLQEQRDAILLYADRNKFSITHWLEERETAAKGGRPIFNQALKLLKKRGARGIILHKLDRGARNLKDWAAIAELSDLGVEVHFVNESLDLQTRGGRLSADIQAVVAADFIRNLKEETRKGFYGRLKQGLYPLRAPLGYLDQGKGKAKTIDPLMGPLVRQAFEMYGTGRHNLKSLGEALYKLGLRNRSGNRVTRNGVSTMLNNPFYTGVVRIHKTGESFSGAHQPLIGTGLFKEVRAVLSGKTSSRNQRHVLLFRRMLTCATCNYSLIGERQKGYVYYRCHSDLCKGTSVREEFVMAGFTDLFKQITFTETELSKFRLIINSMNQKWESQSAEAIQGLKLKAGQISDRLNRLTDAYLDNSIDKDTFEGRKSKLLLEQRSAEENLVKLIRKNGSPYEIIDKYLELAGNALLSYQTGLPEQKRILMKTFTSNRQVLGKTLDLKPSQPFQAIVSGFQNLHCDQQRDRPRTYTRIVNDLIRLNNAGELPDVSAIHEPQGDDTSDEISLQT